MKPRPALPAGPYLVVGLARSGVAAALALRAHGEEVLGLDAGSPRGTAQLREAGTGDKGETLYTVEVLGFDYYDTKEGKITSGSAAHIAVWMLDTDYDGRSLFPRQVFFPMAGEKEGWAKLAKNLKAQIDEELIEAYRGKISLPFAAGEYHRVAVKISCPTECDFRASTAAGSQLLEEVLVLDEE